MGPCESIPLTDFVVSIILSGVRFDAEEEGQAESCNKAIFKKKIKVHLQRNASPQSKLSFLTHDRRHGDGLVDGDVDARGVNDSTLAAVFVGGVLPPSAAAFGDAHVVGAAHVADGGIGQSDRVNGQVGGVHVGDLEVALRK